MSARRRSSSSSMSSKHDKLPHKHALARKPEKESRLSSGIPGLDSLIGGGFLTDDVYLVTGGTGTGKTIFCSQFIMEGLKKGEPGVYFSLEEMPEDVMKDAREFGWDLEKFQKDKLFIMEHQDPFEMADITSEVRKKVLKMKAKRVVIDSTSIFGMIFQTKHELRKRLYELIKALKGTGAVTLMTAEITYGSESLSRFNVEEFVVDGLIVLRYASLGKMANRTLEVRKMRRTKHSEGIHNMSFSNKGISVDQ